jgi:hypothetical protein
MFHTTDPATYCAMANAGYDFICVEQQHSPRDWESVARMWRTCPNAKAVPGVRVAYTDEREIQHALDAGALVIVVPTSTRRRGDRGAQLDLLPAARPPQQRRARRRSTPAMWGSVPGGYRNTINDNIVLIEMIETLQGLAEADKIAKVQGRERALRRGQRPGQLLGLQADSPDYERAINIVHERRHQGGVRLCGPLAWLGRPRLDLLPGRHRGRGHPSAASPPSWAPSPTHRRSPRSAPSRRPPRRTERSAGPSPRPSPRFAGQGDAGEVRLEKVAVCNPSSRGDAGK